MKSMVNSILIEFERTKMEKLNLIWSERAKMEMLYILVSQAWVKQRLYPWMEEVMQGGLEKGPGKEREREDSHLLQRSQ